MKIASPTVFLLVGALALIARRWLLDKQHYMVPPHLSSHPVGYYENLVPEGIAADLRASLKRRGLLYTSNQDTQYYQVLREDVGEAEDMVDGGCPGPYKSPNKNRSKCVLPGRIDVGRHFILTGGPDGLKETYETSVSRLMSFAIFNFEVEEDAMKELFESEKFKAAAKATCPPHAQYVEPFQFNFIVQVPGQTVAAHLDAPYFWGANRFQFPQWLLVVMVFSGLFEDIFVPQVQVVAYIHEWEPKGDSSGGSFLFWGAKESNQTASKPQAKVSKHGGGRYVHASVGTVQPKPRAGVTVDGSKLVHAANIYRAGEELPEIDRQGTPVLSYNKGTDLWDLKVHDKVLRSYTMEDLRISIVFRARCFANEKEAARFQSQLHDNENAMELDEILEVLVKDLQSRGRVGSDAMEMERTTLALKLLDEYIRYPFSPTARFPLNYCALPRILPWTEKILSYIC